MSNIINVNDILNFINIFNNKCEKLKHFLETYEVIIKEDNVKPLFSQTTRYNQFPKNKYITNYKNNPLFNKNDNAWIPNKNKDVIKNIKIILNKVTITNYNKMLINFKNEINNINSIDQIKQICKYLLSKVIKDKEFHDIYLKICKIFWHNDSIKYNLINIIRKNNKYYWEYNNLEMNYVNSYETIELLKSNINSKINFKKILLNIFYDKIKDKEIFYKEENNKFKISIISISLFITNMYINKELNEYEYNNYICNLINNDYIYKEDIEILYTILKDYNNIFSLNLEKIIISKINNLDKINYDDRTQYFIGFIQQNLNSRNNKNNFNNNFNNIVENDIDIEKIFNKYISGNIKIGYFLKIDNVQELLDICLYDIFENSINIDKIIKLITNMYTKRKIHRRHIIKQLYITIENISDISVDFPNGYINFVIFTEKLSKSIKVNLINNKFATKLIKSINNKELLINMILKILNTSNKITNSASQTLTNYRNNNLLVKNI